MGMDLSDLEALMGGSVEQPGGASGGTWVVSPEGALDDHVLRLIGKARVVADSLGGYVYLLLAGGAGPAAAPFAIHAGADRVLLAAGVPSLGDLVDFFRARSPQVILFRRTRLGRTLAPGLAQVLGGGLAGYAADLAVDPISQRLAVHQPILADAARQVVTILGSPAVAVVDAGALPAAFSEPWRSGEVEDTGLSWAPAPRLEAADLPAAAADLGTAALVVAAGRGLRNAAGFELAVRLAQALGGELAGDVAALDAGWIDEERLVGLTGRRVAPRLYLALGISGDSDHLMAITGADTILAVQPDATAPIVQVADWNVLADPAEFAAALLEKLAAQRNPREERS